MLKARLLALCTLALLGASRPLPRDVDIGVPPGSPLYWARAFPAYTPPRQGLFPETPAKPNAKPAESGPNSGRTSSRPAAGALAFRNTDGFGLVRIITRDLPGYFRWMRPGRKRAPTTGSSRFLPGAPEFGSGLYWVSLAPFMRLLLHPQIVPYEPTLAHLLEIGEPALHLVEDLETEQGLRGAATDLRERLVPRTPVKGASRALEAEDARGRMLSRFTFEELLRVHAYDPEESFAKRLLLFADETEPWVLRYAREGNLPLQRAAVAALGRYHTRTAVEGLMERALFAEDAVVVVRALSGLSSVQGPLEVAPLARRLRDEEDPILQTAFCGALGRPRAFVAVEPLLDLARQGIEERRSGVALEALTTRGRIGVHRDFAEELGSFLDSAEDTLKRVPSSFAVRRGNMTADLPDEERDRSDMLLQLLRILRLQLRPGDEESLRELVELADQPKRGAEPHFGRVHPPVRLAYLDALSRAGQLGMERLVAIAGSDEHDASMRGQALRRLPFLERSRLARSWLSPRNTDDLRLVGFETLVADVDPDLIEAGRGLIEEAAALRADSSPARDYLFLRAVRTLSEAGRLEMIQLAPLIFHAENRADVLGERVTPIQERIDRLVDVFVQGKTLNYVKPQIEELVDLVIRSELNSAVNEETRKKVIDYITDEIDGLKAHRRNANYVRNVRTSIQVVLLGWNPSRFDETARTRAGMLKGLGSFSTPVDLGGEVLLALGRTRERTAANLLADFLANRHNRNRAYACLGLGIAGFQEHVKTLASFLLDGDPYVRFCSHEALHRLTGIELDVDWMYGEAADRFDGAETFLKWTLAKKEDGER